MHLIGYGNPGRCDDGLGPAFAARIAVRNLPDLVVSTDYQLTVDHALTVAQAKKVVFVDAMMCNEEPFRFVRALPVKSRDLASHSLEPGNVLALAATLFHAEPEAYILGISGEEFRRIDEGLSAQAEDNLRLAEAFFLEWFRSPEDKRSP